MTKSRLDRLPVWAQEKIRSQAREVTDLGRALRKLQGETGGGLEIGNDPRSVARPLLRLPAETRVRFTQGDSLNWFVDARLKGDTLLLYGADPLVICPTASNCAGIKLQER
jgi:hypothetical protein